MGKMMGELYLDYSMQGTFMSDYAFCGGYVPLKKNKKHWSGVNVPFLLKPSFETLWGCLTGNH